MAPAALSLSITADLDAPYVPYLRRYVRAAHRILRPPLRELSVALVSDERMTQLHRHFLGIAGPTDVLTFPLDHDSRGRPVAAEIVVCVPEARRRAKAEGVPLERELLLYALHGLLHLCGYDDRTDAAFRVMHRAEDQILTRLGVGPVFSPAPAAKAPRNPPPARRRTRRAAVRRRSPKSSGGAD